MLIMQNTLIRKKPNELMPLLTLAMPVVITQAADTIMLFTDRLMLSRLGIEYVAPSMSGGLTSFLMMSLFLGITGYVNTIVAHYFGAKIKSHCARALSQAVFISLLAYPLLIAVSPFVRYLFVFAGHEPDQIKLEYTYFSILIFGSVFGLVRNSIAGFFVGIGKTRMVMIANIVGMLINIPLNFLLIYDVIFKPGLGITGAAIGSICGSCATAVILLAVYLSKRYRREYNTHTEWKPDRKLIKKLLFFGTPAGVEQFLNVGAFNIFVQLMQSINGVVAAAVTITFNYDMVAFIPMIGLNVAIMSLVGRHMGAGDIKGASAVTYLTMKVAFIYAGFMTLLFIFGAPLLVKVFIIPGLKEDHHQVAALAEIMLRLAAIYTLADATQLIFGGALRGAGDTHWCMIISVSLHWVMAVGMYILIKVVKFDPLTIWGFFIVFAVLLGVLILVRFLLGYWKKIKLISDEERLQLADPNSSIN